jgi:CYTH domain-containing protein
VTSRVPGHGRYAHIEREQRWLLVQVPEGVEPLAEIFDRYILGTRMRLRRVISPEGETLKFAQKVRSVADDPESVRLTNMYLSAAEYETLSLLPFAELHKTRRTITVGTRSFAVDEFHDRHRGLVLAETELDEQTPLLESPSFAERDVTHDDRYSGGGLAFADDATLRTLLGKR